MNKAVMTETIMDMIRSADMPAEEIIAALAKRAAKEGSEAEADHHPAPGRDGGAWPLSRRRRGRPVPQ
jgi:hypothetical protein